MTDRTRPQQCDKERLNIFAYGSLIWRPDFPFVERRLGFVHGVARRFWQASHDHRGTPQAPGRVATLEARHQSRCWGVAYSIKPADKARVYSRLDEREQGGYARRGLRFQPKTGDPYQVTAYVANCDNALFVEDESLETTARIISRAHGPSGSNVEYLEQLVSALDELGIQDEYVQQLHAQVVTLRCSAP